MNEDKNIPELLNELFFEIAEALHIPQLLDFILKLFGEKK